MASLGIWVSASVGRSSLARSSVSSPHRRPTASMCSGSLSRSPARSRRSSPTTPCFHPFAHGDRPRSYAVSAGLSPGQLRRRVRFPTRGSRGNVAWHTTEQPFDPVAVFEARQRAGDDLTSRCQACQTLPHRRKRHAHLFSDFRIEPLAVFLEAMQNIDQCQHSCNGTQSVGRLLLKAAIAPQTIPPAFCPKLPRTPRLALLPRTGAPSRRRRRELQRLCPLGAFPPIDRRIPAGLRRGLARSPACSVRGVPCRRACRTTAAFLPHWLPKGDSGSRHRPTRSPPPRAP